MNIPQKGNLGDFFGFWKKIPKDLVFPVVISVVAVVVLLMFRGHDDDFSFHDDRAFHDDDPAAFFVMPFSYRFVVPGRVMVVTRPFRYYDASGQEERSDGRRDRAGVFRGFEGSREQKGIGIFRGFRSEMPGCDIGFHARKGYG
jgi:hypothetical protein